MPEQPKRDEPSPRVAGAIDFLRRRRYRVLPAGSDHMVIGSALWIVSDDQLIMMAKAERWGG